MKTFSDEALAALQRGDAIVSASVEIIPSASVYEFSVVETVDLASIANASTTKGGGLTAGVTVSGFSPSDLVRVTQPGGGTFTAIRPRSDLGWDNRVDIIPDGVSGNSFFVNETGSGVSFLANHSHFASAAAAQAAFGSHTFSGASSYTFYYFDDPTTDNIGGLSILVEQGTLVAGGTDPIRLWGGYGAADLPSDEGTSTFQGIGDRGLINQSAGAIGGSAQNLTLSLSGIEPAALELLDPSEVKGASAVVRRLIYDSAGKTLLGAYVYTRGRVDELKTSEVVGGSATIELSIEGAARGLGRRGGRIRSDADQRLVSATDGFYRVVSAAPKKTLYWGGKRPSVAGSAVGGG